MTPELDIIDVGRASFLVKRQQLVCAPVEAAHPGVRLRPHNEVERVEPGRDRSRMHARIAAPIDEGADDAALGEMMSGSLDPGLVEIPVSLLAEAIDSDPEKAPLGRRQMARHDTGQALHAYLARCLDPGPTVEQATVLIDQNWYAEAERRNRVRNFPHMRRIGRPHVPGRC